MRSLYLTSCLLCMFAMRVAHAQCTSHLPFVDVDTKSGSVAYTGDKFVFSITPPLDARVNPPARLKVTSAFIDVIGGETLNLTVPPLGANSKHWFEVPYAVGQKDADSKALKLDPIDTPTVRVRFTDSSGACYQSINIGLNTKDPGVFALIVGINSYPELGSPLRFARKDAEAVVDYLIKNFPGMKRDHVMLRTDDPPAGEVDKYQDIRRNATRDLVLKAMSRIAKEIDKAGTIVFYFSGHGYAPSGGSTFLVPEKAPLDDHFMMLSVSELLDQMQKVRVDRTVLLLDACFSEFMIRDDPAATPALRKARRAFGTVNSDSGLEELVRSKQVYVLTSSTGGEFSYELDDQNLQHGAFTYYLLNPDQTQNPDPRMTDPTLQGVYNSMLVAIPREIRARLGQSQTPFHIVIGGGDKIIWAPRGP